METHPSQTRWGPDSPGLRLGRRGRGDQAPLGDPVPSAFPPLRRAVPTPLAPPRAAGDEDAPPPQGAAAHLPLFPSSHKSLSLPDSSPLPLSFPPSFLPSSKF